MFIAVGDDEYQNPDKYEHDLDFEAMKLYKQAERVPNLSAELRVLNGGHDWNVWGPAFAEGAKYAFQFVARPEVSIMKASLVGTAGEEREGGVAVDAAGNVYEALAAEGSVDGQPYAAAKDVVLIKYDPAGTKLWTREFGTAGVDRAYGLALDPSGHPVVAGYTKGDLDGAHAGNTSDDMFVAKYDPSGTREWVRQVGLSTVADRAYGVAVDGDGSVYAAGYTKGALAGTYVGDKDVVLVKLDGSGAPVWMRQFGAVGEDKAMAVVGEGRRRLGRRHDRRHRRHRPYPGRRRAASTPSSPATTRAGRRSGRGSSARPPRTRRGASRQTPPGTRPSPGSPPGACSRRSPATRT